MQAVDAVQKAYEAIRRGIGDGTFPSGDRLVERRLCDAIGVSRTPVREALHRLAAEGLLEVDERGGMVVVDTAGDGEAELYTIGAMLEGFAARIASQKITIAALNRLQAIIAEIEALLPAAAGDGDGDERATARARIAHLDADFHGIVIEAAGNARLVALLRQVIGVPFLLRVFHHYTDAQLVRSSNHHREIWEALNARDAEWAESTMRNHILWARAGKHYG